jgi:hypothetical protein
MAGTGTGATEKQGIAYVYDISTFGSSTIASANYTLTNPDKYGSSSNDRFGSAIAIEGTKIVVAAAREQSSSGVAEDGVLYVYDISTFGSSVISSSAFSIDNPNYGSDAATGDKHGETVAISEDYIVSGSRWNSTPFYSAGTIYIYNASNGNLMYTVASPSASNVTNQWFGNNIALDGNNLYGQVYANAIYTIYHYDIGSFTASTPAVIAAGTGIENTLSRAGESNSISFAMTAYNGKLIIAGEDDDATNGSSGTLTDSGVAYVYE